ncbi:hypothetical protein Tco_0732906 [Tanacetum coccineum]
MHTRGCEVLGGGDHGGVLSQFGGQGFNGEGLHGGSGDGGRFKSRQWKTLNQIAQLNAIIAEMEPFDDPGEVFNKLMGLRDDVRVENAKLIGLNELVTQAEEEIKMKEAQLEVNDKYETCMEILLVNPNKKVVSGVSYFCGVVVRCLIDYGVWYVHFGVLDAYVTAGSLAKLSEVVESPHLEDKMKYVFGRSRGEDESFARLIRDLCFSLRISLSKKRRLVAELEAVGEVEGVVKCLEHMRVIVARDTVTLWELETLLGRAQVGVSLKAGFVADMEIYIYTLSLKVLTMATLYILDKLVEVADSSHLQNKMKVVFVESRVADESFIALIGDLCSALRVSITKNRRLIAELETLGQRGEALKLLDYMKEIVARDSATLRVLEQLLAGTHVGMRLKASYVAEMEETK